MIGKFFTHKVVLGVVAFAGVAVGVPSATKDLGELLGGDKPFTQGGLPTPTTQSSAMSAMTPTPEATSATPSEPTAAAATPPTTGKSLLDGFPTAFPPMPSWSNTGAPQATKDCNNTPPDVSLEPTSGPTGSWVRVRSKGYQKGEKVEVSTSAFDLWEATADARGSIAVRVRIPAFVPGNNATVDTRGTKSDCNGQARFMIKEEPPDGSSPR